MRVNDAIVGACLIALAAAILVHIQGYPLIPGQRYGPALFPGVIAVGLIATGAILFVRGLRQGTPLVVLGEWLRRPMLVTNFLTVCAALVFYVVAADALGFIITSIVFLGALFLKFGVRLALALPVALVATLIIHTLFYKVLRVPLPWGVLERFAW
jgi:putative tricarboxylic transport membrane protein